MAFLFNLIIALTFLVLGTDGSNKYYLDIEGDIASPWSSSFSLDPFWFYYYNNLTNTSMDSISWNYLTLHGLDPDCFMETEGIWAALNGTIYDENPDSKTFFPFVEFNLGSAGDEYVTQLGISFVASPEAKLALEVDGLEIEMCNNAEECLDENISRWSTRIVSVIGRKLNIIMKTWKDGDFILVDRIVVKTMSADQTTTLESEPSSSTESSTSTGCKHSSTDTTAWEEFTETTMESVSDDSTSLDPESTTTATTRGQSSTTIRTSGSTTTSYSYNYHILIFVQLLPFMVL